jgi:hypothetical protein
MLAIWTQPVGSERIVNDKFSADKSLIDNSHELGGKQILELSGFAC